MKKGTPGDVSPGVPRHCFSLCLAPERPRKLVTLQELREHSQRGDSGYNETLDHLRSVVDGSGSYRRAGGCLEGARPRKAPSFLSPAEPNALDRQPESLGEVPAQLARGAVGVSAVDEMADLVLGRAVMSPQAADPERGTVRVGGAGALGRKLEV